MHIKCQLKQTKMEIWTWNTTFKCFKYIQEEKVEVIMHTSEGLSIYRNEVNDSLKLTTPTTGVSKGVWDTVPISTILVVIQNSSLNS